MHGRQVGSLRVAALCASVLAAGCIETLGTLDATSTSGGIDEPAGCDDNRDARTCIEAGCNWQALHGVMIAADATCVAGPPWGLCYPDSLAQPCDPSAMQCDDGRHVWVLPGPDNAMVFARSPTSCDLPQHFLPCPSPGAAEGDVAEACACACAALP